MSNKEKSIGALWEKDWGFSGSIEIDGSKYQFVCFQNKYKKEDKHPDYQIFAKRQKE